MFNKVVLVVSLALAIEGCTPFDFVKMATSSLDNQSLVNVGDKENQTKLQGSDLKAHTNNGHMIGGNYISLPKKHDGTIIVTQMSWFNVFETIMLIVLSITTGIGWFKPIMEWFSKKKKDF